MSTMNAAIEACAARVSSAISGVTPAAVYSIVAQSDVTSIADLTSLPVVMVRFAPSYEQSWGRMRYGGGVHRWGMRIDVYLSNVAPDTEEREAALDAAFFPWPKALADCLYGDMTLGGTVKRIGYGTSWDELFPTIAVGGMRWRTREYWGGGFLLPVMQTHNQTMSA